jgi:UDP-glucose 4-epimerase
MEWAIIRPPLVYGKGAKANFRLLTSLVGKQLPLPMGCARNTRSFVSARNLSSALVHMAADERGRDRILLPADDRDLSTREMIALIAQAKGCSARLVPVPRSLLLAGATLLGRRRIYDTLFGDMAVDRTHWPATGWSPIETVEDGIRNAVA